MAIKQLFGRINADGTIVNSSVNFSVDKKGAGTYRINFAGVFSMEPAISVLPIDPYLSANATIDGFDDPDACQVLTGYTSDSTKYEDMMFYFIAVGE